MIKICHLTTAHSRYDDRIFIKECTSLANAGYDLTLLVADGKPDEEKNGVKIISVTGIPKSRFQRIILSSNIIEESRCGWTISPGKPEAMAEKILDIKSTDAELLQTMGYNGRQYIFENLQYSLLAQNFIKYISVL